MLTVEVVRALVRRPDLWSTGVATALSMAPSGWWRERPFAPLPDPAWMHFRLETAYGGDGDQPMRGEDLVAFLEWKRSLTTP